MTATDAQVRIIMRERNQGKTQEQAGKSKYRQPENSEQI